ncbi:hypothetical protein ACQKIE_18850 [Luteibacter sp. NPDC031894]|uniref:hypothetical protein n=1 Tax=Luteibacter sp. NPDC031894 TaxID=3390572 RepID=UPI003D014011
MDNEKAVKASDRRAVMLIAVLGGLLALLLRWYFVTHAQVLQTVDQENIRGDAVQYYRYAWNMVHRSVFSSASPATAVAVPNSFRDPGYPLLMAGVLASTSSFQMFYGVMLLLQAFLGALTVSLLVLAARDWLSTAALAVAAVVMAIWPHSVAITAYLLSETLVGLLCAASLLTLSWAVRRPSAARYIATGLSFGLAAMTNAALIPLGCLLAITLYWRKLSEPRLVLALALASLALPTAWGVRSLTLPPSTSATSRAITNLVQGSWPTYHVAYQLAASEGDPESMDQLRGMQYEMDLLQKDPMAGLALMRHRMSELPVPYLLWYLGKPKLLWDWDIRIGQGDIYVYATRASPFEKGGPWAPMEAACFMLNPILMVLALVGAIAAMGLRRREGMAIACSALAIFVTLVYSVLQSEPRYSIPFRGIEILLATGGAAWLISTMHRWKASRDVDHASHPGKDASARLGTKPAAAPASTGDIP